MTTEMNNYEKALLMCCGEYDENRDWLFKPFTIGDYTYATDAHGLLRVPNHLLRTEYECKENVPLKKIPDMFNIIPEYKHCFTSKKLQQLLNSLSQIPEMKPPVDKCEKCNGEGSYECSHCGSWVDCKECNGTGYFDNPKPTGRMIPQNTNVKIGEIVFQSKFLVRLLDVVKTIKYRGDINLFISNTKRGIFKLGDVKYLLMATLGEAEKKMKLEN